MTEKKPIIFSHRFTSILPTVGHTRRIRVISEAFSLVQVTRHYAIALSYFQIKRRMIYMELAEKQFVKELKVTVECGGTG